MSRQLWQISIETSAQAEEAIVELLGGVFKIPAAVYANAETGISAASVYCARPAKNGLWRNALSAGLESLRTAGLDIGPGRIHVRRVAREDWAESWKRHFKPIEIGPRLLIKPSWFKRRPLKDQAVVVLDPGLSFGTGNHPTTAFCLSELAGGRDSKTKQSFLDIGTGSGILAIAAAKLGYAPVRALDFDPEAVRVARENARRNRITTQVRFARADITKLSAAPSKKFDFICANLISNLLITERRRIAGRLHRGGRLVLAGILRGEFARVQKAYEQLGLKLARSRGEGEWRSGTFVFSMAIQKKSA